ncbi:MAG TPA: UPF0158 family protein [Thermoleophilaceae bacterium]
MLDPEQVDLADLALALEDHSEEHSWWLDADTGEVEPHFTGEPETAHFPESDGRRLILVEPLPTAIGYGDMEDFVAFVREPRTRDLLERAIAGRGALRRFKDTLLDYPELREAWFAFHDARGERRAIECVAHRVALDLERIYRERLRGVLLLGAWASGEAHPEAELELLVVLDDVDDRWEERRRMDRVMWRHSVRNDTVVTGIPVTEAELERGDTPLLSRALAEGVRVE